MSAETAIDNLKAEHRLIESVLGALTGYAGALAHGEKVGRTDLAHFVRFMHEFADIGHHAKEETILFRAMTDNGFPHEGGPLPCMLHEHDTGRNLVKDLEDFVKQDAWSDAVVQSILETGSQLQELLRGHIYKEDHILYQIAQSHLSSEQMIEVDRLCAQRDRENRESGKTAALEAIANELIGAYGCAKQAVG